MLFKLCLGVALSFLLPAAYAAGPEDQLVSDIKTALDKNFEADWRPSKNFQGSSGHLCRQPCSRTVCPMEAVSPARARQRSVEGIWS
jgi:hypothetical protein